ncbi:hypothetical protein Ae717Ps2_6510c [Pseudonocardia sp. Ae717_Ps2]|nr:hypothetical protein Ae717Ps2_6510c [Pseudonocardia sp. Ae717_Ps2]
MRRLRDLGAFCGRRGTRWPRDAFDDGVWRQTRGEAMTRQHVELHPKHVWGLIGVDVDHPDAVLRMVSTVDNHPPPNVIIENPRERSRTRRLGHHDPHQGHQLRIPPNRSATACPSKKHYAAPSVVTRTTRPG